MTARDALPSARWLPWAIALGGFALDVAAWWPGQMSFDSAYAWWQARGGATTTVASPTMVRVWRIGETLVSGPGSMFALHLALFWSGLALLASAPRLRAAAAIALMLVVALAPVPWLLRGHVWTDVGLFSALAFATGALATAQATRSRAGLAAALPALFYAAALRHNALPAVLPLAIWFAAIGWDFAQRSPSSGAKAHRKPSWWAKSRPMAMGFALCAGLGAGVALVNARAMRQVPVWTSLAQWDLAAVSVAEGRMLLPDFMIGPGLDVAELAAAFRPWSNVPMLQTTRHGMRDPFEGDYTDEQLSTLRRAWLDAIVRHSGAWLAHRARLARALVGAHPADRPRELVYVDDEFRYRDNPPVARNASGLHRALMRAADALRTTALLAGWPYLSLGLFAAPFAWRRRAHPAASIALVLLASAWLYAATLVALAPSAELRYLGWPIVASLAAAALVASVLRREADKLSGVPKPRIAMTRQRYFISIEDLPKARGQSHELSFHGGSPESFAALLEQSLREPSLWQRWKSMQPDPEAVDPALGAIDPSASVAAEQSDLHCDAQVVTSLPHAILKHRLDLLIGKNWTLRDVRAA